MTTLARPRANSSLLVALLSLVLALPIGVLSANPAAADPVPPGATLEGQLSGDGVAYRVTAHNLTTGESFNTTAPAGPYALTTLPPGDYVVGAIPSTSTAAQVSCGPTTWYGGTEFLTATQLHLAAGTVLPGVDLTASCTPPSPAGLSGTLQLPAGVTLTPDNAGNLRISLRDAVTGTLVATTWPLADATFSWPSLTPGDYTRTVTDTGLGMAVSSQQVTVAATGTEGVVVPMRRGGVVTGTLVDPDGRPVAGMAVWVETLDGSRRTVQTDSTGTFIINGLETGTYQLSCHPGSEFLSSLATASVTVEQTTALGTLGLQPAGQVGGTVPRYGGGQGAITVDVLDASGDVMASTVASWSGSTVGAVDYVVSDVPPGVAYVRFSGPNVVTEWWQDALDQASSVPVTVIAGQTVTGISPNLSFLPQPVPATVTVSGTVLSPSGPAAGVTIGVWSAPGPFEQATTGSDGRYTMQVPQGANYLVTAFQCWGYSTGGLACTGDRYLETRLVSVGAEPVDGVDFAMTPGSFTTDFLPQWTGSPVAGQTLTARSPNWDPRPDKLTWQWYADGVPIPGATGASFAVTDGQTGQQLSVAATAEKSGYVTKVLYSQPTPVVVGTSSVTPAKPAIAGTPVVGVSLTADPGTWQPTGTAFAFQWERDGLPIAGATGATYTLAADDVGHHVSVVVTGTAPGFNPTSAESATTVLVQATSSDLAYQAFVKASYSDFLGRMPTETELASAEAALSSGTLSKPDFLRQLATSDEWLGVIVTNLYRDTLRRTPDAAGLKDWVSWLRTGRFTVAQTAALFYASDEYYQVYAGGSASTWVTSLYQKLLNREPDALGLAHWIALTNDPAYGRARVAYDFYQTAESRMHRVQALYQALLQRDPDPTGWPFWTDRVYTTGDIVLAINLADSEEYWQRALQRY